MPRPARSGPGPRARSRRPASRPHRSRRRAARAPARGPRGHRRREPPRQPPRACRRQVPQGPQARADRGLRERGPRWARRAPPARQAVPRAERGRRQAAARPRRLLRHREGQISERTHSDHSSGSTVGRTHLHTDSRAAREAKAWRHLARRGPRRRWRRRRDGRQRRYGQRVEACCVSEESEVTSRCVPQLSRAGMLD